MPTGRPHYRAWKRGITACFVNVGSDHPSIIETIVKRKRERPHNWLRMITCPSEVITISMIDGYARVAGRPQAVLVHVDVGTQALGQGIHNASVGHVPEAPDQKANIWQYCRYTGEVHTGLIVKQTIEHQRVPIGPTALPPDALRDIATALVHAERPLIITGYSGRDQRTPDDVCFPFSHPASKGSRFRMYECTKDADVILLLDYDVPWIPSHNAPPPDYLLTTMLQDPKFAPRRATRTVLHKKRMAEIASQLKLDDEDQLDAHNVGNILKTSLPESATFVVEAVTSAQALFSQLQPDRPGSWINCRRTGIGWSNCAVLGVKMALDDMEKDHDKPNLVCQLVDDGSFMCAAPSSALWVASKCNISVLTVVLNNKGPPKLYPAYPNGLNATVSDEEINVSFSPTPNYAALAGASAGSKVEWENNRHKLGAWMQGLRVRPVGELNDALRLASRRISEAKRGMLIEVLMWII
ncbi:thiamine pyrophosphate enzyme [Xylaria sp. FL1777]|nr:thiamine pyrophosphate enzyme [Xylaria sp. FL1777]